LLKKQFRSPYDGVILEMQLKKGEAATQYQSYASIAPAGSLMVRAEVDELFSARVKVGQPVDVSFIGNEQVVAHGTVSSVGAFLRKKSLFSDKANDQEDRRVLEIHVTLQQPVQLIINAKVECKIKL
jgi:multidrug resistance efflux pump